MDVIKTEKGCSTEERVYRMIDVLYYSVYIILNSSLDRRIS